MGDFHRKVRLKNIGTGFLSIARWSAVALLIGAACGLAGTGFYYAVNGADTLLSVHTWLIWFLPAAGIVIVWVNRRMGTGALSTDSVLDKVQNGGNLPVPLIPAVFIGTFLTHLAGGSSGREGAAFQIGGTIGNRIAGLLHQNDYEIRVATMAGMAALFAAIFGLPVTATIFVVLVISVGEFWHSAIYPVMIASLTAYWISGTFGIRRTAFALQVPDAAVSMVFRVAVLSILCAFVSTVLCDLLHDTARLLTKKFPNPYIRIAVTGAAVSILIYLTREDGRLVYSGAGSGLIRAAIEEGTARPWDFVLKLLLTVLTLAAGYKGGEVLPSFAIGATFGCAVGPFLGIPAPFAAAVGLISVFGGASNSLIAPIFLGIEMFGSKGIHYYAIAAVLSYVMSGYAGFYYNQVIVYSKIAPVKLLLHTNDLHDQTDDPGRSDNAVNRNL